MSRRAGPRSIGEAIRGVRAESQPATLLAAAQSVWADVAGEQIAREARPVRERDRIVTVSCAAATWAQELDLLQEELLERLNQALAPRQIAALRFVVGEDGGADLI